ncbi:MAG: cold shock domain-containing protein [Candidatus Riflebacteria bacterium]|nr:cold shock domain-containing protein [Candidatus Riflebacteria bacterium]
MQRSRVKWFDNVKGYGFIESTDGKDIFVHYKQIEGDGYKTLKEGQIVEFDLTDGEKGPLATNVRVTEN